MEHRSIARAFAAAACLAGACAAAGNTPAQERVRRTFEDRKPARIDVRAPEVALVMHRWGPRPVIEVGVNGRGPYRFFLDTGASGSAITAELAEELGLAVVGAQRISSPGQPGVDVDIVRADSLTLDGIAVHGLEIPTLPPGMLPAGDDVPRGVLSLRELHGLLVTFDFAASRIRLAPGALPEPDGRTVLAYEAPRGIPEVPIRIGGVALTAHLDTGAPGEFSVPLAQAKDLPLEAEPVEVGKGRRAGGEVTIYEARLRGTVEFGGYTFENPTLKFTDVGTHVNVGSVLLERYVLTLDREQRRLRLVPAAGPAAAE